MSDEQALVARVGGRQFYEPAPEDIDFGTCAHEGTLALFELLHLGRVDSRSVAALFGRDQEAILDEIAKVRADKLDCGGHDEGVVLDHLRRALRNVVDGQAGKDRAWPIAARSRQPRLALLSDDEAAADREAQPLDLGLSV